VALLPLGLQAFTEWTPLRPGPLYRTRRWGRHVELLVLDTRSARDPNDAADLAERPKSMLGAAQRAWLASAVGTDATWLVVVSSVPLSIPTGAWVRDGWASDGGPTGFARELAELLRLLRDRGRRQVIWITTDVHFTAFLQHRPLADDPGFVVYELAVGPLNAGIAPLKAPDPGYRTQPLFVLGPDPWQTIRSLDEALGYFTFGLLEVDAGGRLAAEVVDATGRVRYRLELVP
jgi:alkaline phosphatase D